MAITDQLRAAWSFDTSTGLLVDSGPNGYTFTNNNTVVTGTGKINEAADFGNPNANKSLTNTSLLGMTFNDSFTFNFWLNVTAQPASGTSSTPIGWSDNATANNHGYNEVQLFNNAGTMQVYIARNNVTTNNQVGANQTFTPGTWYMLTYRWDGSTQTLCINANHTPLLTQASTITGTSGANGQGTVFQVGRDTVNLRALNGLIDICSVWNRAITDTEMDTLYNAGSGVQYPFGAAPAASGRDARNLNLLGVG